MINISQLFRKFLKEEFCYNRFVRILKSKGFTYDQYMTQYFISFGVNDRLGNFLIPSIVEFNLNGDYWLDITNKWITAIRNINPNSIEYPSASFMYSINLEYLTKLIQTAGLTSDCDISLFLSHPAKNGVGNLLIKEYSVNKEDNQLQLLLDWNVGK